MHTHVMNSCIILYMFLNGSCLHLRLESMVGYSDFSDPACAGHIADHIRQGGQILLLGSPGGNQAHHSPIVGLKPWNAVQLASALVWQGPPNIIEGL